MNEATDEARPPPAKLCPRHGKFPSLDCAWCAGHSQMARWDFWPWPHQPPNSYKPEPLPPFDPLDLP